MIRTLAARLKSCPDKASEGLKLDADSRPPNRDCTRIGVGVKLLWGFAPAAQSLRIAGCVIASFGESAGGLHGSSDRCTIAESGAARRLIRSLLEALDEFDF
jgi:hypothetical protein